jgi:hypothetical protein
MLIFVEEKLIFKKIIIFSCQFLLMSFNNSNDFETNFNVQ